MENRGLDSSVSGHGQVAGYCECSYELSGAVNILGISRKPEWLLVSRKGVCFTE